MAKLATTHPSYSVSKLAALVAGDSGQTAGIEALAAWLRSWFPKQRDRLMAELRTSAEVEQAATLKDLAEQLAAAVQALQGIDQSPLARDVQLLMKRAEETIEPLCKLLDQSAAKAAPTLALIDALAREAAARIDGFKRAAVVQLQAATTNGATIQNPASGTPAEK
jgi:hypothetical protein